MMEYFIPYLEENKLDPSPGSETSFNLSLQKAEVTIFNSYAEGTTKTSILGSPAKTCLDEGILTVYYCMWANSNDADKSHHTVGGSYMGTGTDDQGNTITGQGNWSRTIYGEIALCQRITYNHVILDSEDKIDLTNTTMTIFGFYLPNFVLPFFEIEDAITGDQFWQDLRLVLINNAETAMILERDGNPVAELADDFTRKMVQGMSVPESISEAKSMLKTAAERLGVKAATGKPKPADPDKEKLMREKFTDVDDEEPCK